MTKPYTITAKDFRDLIWEQIKDLPLETEIYFGNGDLSYNRTKWRGDYFTIEFNQVYTVNVDPEVG